MTKTELEEKIKNGESVWCVYKDQSNIYEIKAVEIEKVLNDTFLWGKEYYANIKDVYKTKAEAEHYLHHANITRTETLPFLTWEEFKEGKELRFYNGKYTYKMNWVVNPEIIVIKRYLDFDIDEFIFNERLTESNFYRAYDVCVELFRGKANDRFKTR